MSSFVSIIIPCYNQAKYLPEALQSVLEQTYDNWECIIVNDGSPDNTDEVAKEWCARDSRFKYLKKENGGLSSARNAGIKTSTGEFILPLDADDKIGNQYLAEGISVLINQPDVALVYCEAEFFGDKTGRWQLPEFTLEKLAISNMIFCSAIFRRKDFDDYGPYDEQLLHGLEDWDLWLSILKNNGNVIKLPEVHFYYRKLNSGSMMDLMQNEKRLNEALNLIYDKHRPFYNELFGNPISVFEKYQSVFAERNNLEEILKRLKQSWSYKIGSFFKSHFGR